jgi:hypothetical protein
MIPFDQMQYHPTSEKLVDVLRDHTQRDDSLFFRVMVGYYFCLAASQMRCVIATPDRGEIPTNMYSLNLAPSGYGKTMSMNLLEEHVLGRFRHQFLNETFPILADQNLPKIAIKRAAKNGTDLESEEQLIKKAFDRMGPLLFSFDSGTSPAVKQMRDKLLMADAGSLNLIMDEVGNNLSANIEVFDTFIELFDKGMVKQKLIKNTTDNVRNEEILGKTPANLLMFGVPNKLFDGSHTESDLLTMLESGYARRCFFAYVRNSDRRKLSAEEMFDIRTSQKNSAFVDTLSERLEDLADIINANKKLTISRETCILLNEYQLHCEERAIRLPEHQEMQKRELSERNFKVLKLAGAYAFIDDSPVVTDEHIQNAIKLAEDSGAAFSMMLSRDTPWMKLAKYIAAAGADVTHADLAQELPFYKGGSNARQEMLTHAVAWGYKNNIIIKKSFSDGIEFLRGESLKETDLSKMIMSWSDHEAYRYNNDHGPFDQLHKLTQAGGLHWTNHHMLDGHRNEENAMPGFNMVVLDVEDSCSIATAKLLLKNYKYLLYTTKRHQTTDEKGKNLGDRYRILLPTNYELKLDARDFKEFMNNVYQWAPFKVDDKGGINTRSKKWLSHEGTYEYNDGELLDVLPFIPKTAKNEQRKQLLDSQQSMDNLERWVINNIGDGNRNNMLLRYAMLLLDAGFDFEGIRARVVSLNDKIADKLDEVEIMGTIMLTVGRTLAQRVPA